MRVLVTGAGGFVGRYMVASLLELGHDVIAVSRRQVDLDCKVISFDMRQELHVKEALAEHRPEGIVHLAAQASVPESWKDPNLTYRINILGASNVLEALRDHPETRVLLIGSAQQYGRRDLDRPITEDHPMEPTSPYALSKVAQELIGRFYFSEFGRPVVMARAFNHTGPGQTEEYVVGSFARQLADIKLGKAEPVIKVGNLDSVRDFLDVRDVVDAYRLLLEKGDAGEVYNVCSGEGRQMGEILKGLIAVSGLDGQVEIDQDDTTRPGDSPVLVGDNSKVRSAVGWSPQVPFERSLADTFQWCFESPA
ncbi:MAG: GDP-mannose 4,6-dehydratase [Actinobacteria bacterium]|nr:GDP-mannose 4,6-dehydratase [Actinomycetota bacterium]